MSSITYCVFQDAGWAGKETQQHLAHPPPCCHSAPLLHESPHYQRQTLHPHVCQWPAILLITQRTACKPPCHSQFTCCHFLDLYCTVLYCKLILLAVWFTYSCVCFCLVSIVQCYWYSLEFFCYPNHWSQQSWSCVRNFGKRPDYKLNGILLFDWVSFVTNFFLNPIFQVHCLRDQIFSK